MLTDELIARRPSGRTGLADWYAEVFRAQDAEGLSATDLATLLSVTPTNIYYWRRRLRELDAAAEGANPSQGGSGLVSVDVHGRSLVQTRRLLLRLRSSPQEGKATVFTSQARGQGVRSLEPGDHAR